MPVTSRVFTGDLDVVTKPEQQQKLNSNSKPLIKVQFPHEPPDSEEDKENVKTILIFSRQLLETEEADSTTTTRNIIVKWRTVASLISELCEIPLQSLLLVRDGIRMVSYDENAVVCLEEADDAPSLKLLAFRV